MITVCSPGYSWLSKESFLMNGSTGGSGANLVAIDSKIEQAMDLVKTHLMYAVREEVEVLRAKITDLENTVVSLEAENRVLRDNIEPEVLARLSATLMTQDGDDDEDDEDGEDDERPPSVADMDDDEQGDAGTPLIQSQK